MPDKYKDKPKFLNQASEPHLKFSYGREER